LQELSDAAHEVVEIGLVAVHLDAVAARGDERRGTPLILFNIFRALAVENTSLTRPVVLCPGLTYKTPAMPCVR
jgi:hypothetical protein